VNSVTMQQAGDHYFSERWVGAYISSQYQQ
jgi:hypothetical protein